MDKIIKCVAIDDEPLALDVISKFCDRIGSVELFTFSDPIAGLETIKRIRPDIAFLDIEMENVNGLTIASELPPETCFIFTTAYLNYALEGFNLDAVDYLHKPFSYSRFETAFVKALRRVEYNKNSGQPRSITVKQEYNNVTIPLDDILYIEAMEGYSKIFRVSDKCVVSRVILKNISTLLPETNFIRIHRSYIVSMSKIKTYTKQGLTLVSGIALPIGRQYRAKVISSLKS